MRDFLAEVHHRAWAAAAVGCTLAVACASMRLGMPTALAVMATGAILMWISEEEKRIVAAMTPGDDPMPVPDAKPDLAPVAVPSPVLVPAHGSAALVREWANPFPAAQPARRKRQGSRRAGGRRA